MFVQQRYTLHFNSPAFLGNAEQSAQWRTPPFKALLRQWWRVAWAQQQGFRPDIAAMRREEGLLFGRADDASTSKSKIRLRLNHWSEGTLLSGQWQSSGTVTHPEVKDRNGNSAPVGSDLYLGYGPLTFKTGRTQLKANAVIQPGEHAIFSLAYPEQEAGLIEQALYLLDRFGTVGGRSRNGWGSLHLVTQESTPALQGKLPLHDWQQALSSDWPHAIGQDGAGPLIWQTKPFDDWKQLMQELARIKIELRTQFKFPHAVPDGQIHQRHWLSYPVTRHSVRAWGGNARLPNSLRFKVRPAQGQPGQLVGVVFHMPCLPPPSFQPDRRAIIAVWQRVHAYLDSPRGLRRISA